MTGSIQEKNGKYYTVLNIKDKNGKYKRNGRPQDCRKRQQTKGRTDFAPAHCRIRSQSAANAENLSFADWMRFTVESKKNTVAPTTYNGYCDMVRLHIAPYFEERRVLLNRIKQQVLWKPIISKN